MGEQNLSKVSKIPSWVRTDAYAVFSLLVVAIAAALRFYKLGGTSLWLDEAVYATNAFNPFPEFLHLTRTNNSTPIGLPFLYWLFGKRLWDPLLIRLFPAIFGTLVIVVVLKMTDVGLRRVVTIPAAVWLSLSHLQIEYSQEVREYSLSVLVATLLLYGFLGSVSSPGEKKNEGLFALTLFVAPLSSYGDVLLGAALLLLHVIVSIRERRFSVRSTGMLWGCFGVSLLLSYLLIARYQFGVSHAEYLAGHYPVGTLSEVLRWLCKSTMSYLRLGSVVPKSGVFVSVILVTFGLYSLQGKTSKRGEAMVVWTLFLLLLISVALAFLHVYPFGGMRQHLFATPVIVLATVGAFLTLTEACRIPPRLGALALTLLVTTLLVRKIPRVYREHQDIRSTVNAISPDIGDQNVFIYFAAVPAVSFHFPEHAFFRSKATEGDIEQMADEVQRLPGCVSALVFSHILKRDDKELVRALARRGYRSTSTKKFKGAALFEVSRCDKGGSLMNQGGH